MATQLCFGCAALRKPASRHGCTACTATLLFLPCFVRCVRHSMQPCQPFLAPDMPCIVSPACISCFVVPSLHACQAGKFGRLPTCLVPSFLFLRPTRAAIPCTLPMQRLFQFTTVLRHACNALYSSMASAAEGRAVGDSSR